MLNFRPALLFVVTLCAFPFSHAATGIKITHVEVVCERTSTCNSPTDYQVKTENVSAILKGSWKKRVNYKDQGFFYAVDFNNSKNGPFIYSSVYQGDPKNGYDITSGGALVRDLNDTFITQVQGPRQFQDGKFVTSLIVIHDKNTDLEDLNILSFLRVRTR